jgi:hypothetical protein
MRICDVDWRVPLVSDLRRVFELSAGALRATREARGVRARCDRPCFKQTSTLRPIAMSKRVACYVRFTSRGDIALMSRLRK